MAVDRLSPYADFGLPVIEKMIQYIIAINNDRMMNNVRVRVRVRVS